MIDSRPLAPARGVRPWARATRRFRYRPSPAWGLVLLLAAVPLRTLLAFRTEFADITVTEFALPVAVVWTLLFRRRGRIYLPLQVAWPFGGPLRCCGPRRSVRSPRNLPSGPS